MRHEFIAVDIQNEFASKGGKFYSYKPSVEFLQKSLFPFFNKYKIKLNEVVSDYRQPRRGDSGDGCYPGDWGYESLIPKELVKATWVKSMNSPIWIREGGGDSGKVPGEPYPDSKKFGEWLNTNLGGPDDVIPVVFGLTIDCCVLSMIQELKWRGYKPLVLKEAVDHASGKIEDRDIVLEKTAISWWAEVVEWEDLKNDLT